ncbi:MAG: lysozyme-like domain containing protein, partial [Wenzhouxiangella sp.]
MPKTLPILRSLSIVLVIALLTGCASGPPRNQDNVCKVFEENPRWYDQALASQKRWGTPIA